MTFYNMQSIAFVTFLFFSIGVQAGPLGYLACMAVCTAGCHTITATAMAATGGIATPAAVAADAQCCATCAVGCSGGWLGCFDGTTTFVVSSGQDKLHKKTIPISDVDAGDYVLTLDDTNTSLPTWTKVIDMKVHDSAEGFNFVRISTPDSDLCVTDDHVAAVIKDTSSSLVATRAEDVQNKDKMPAIGMPTTPAAPAVINATVVSIKPYRASTKIELVTESGTVLAFGPDGMNGLFVTTVCAEYVMAGSSAPVSKVLSSYRADHGFE